MAWIWRLRTVRTSEHVLGDQVVLEVSTEHLSLRATNLLSSWGCQTSIIFLVALVHPPNVQPVLIWLPLIVMAFIELCPINELVVVTTGWILGRMTFLRPSLGLPLLHNMLVDLLVSEPLLSLLLVLVDADVDSAAVLGIILCCLLLRIAAGTEGVLLPIDLHVWLL